MKKYQFRDEINDLKEILYTYKSIQEGNTSMARLTVIGLIGIPIYAYFGHTKKNRIQPIEMLIKSLEEEKDIATFNETYSTAIGLINKYPSDSTIYKKLKVILGNIDHKLNSFTAYLEKEGTLFNIPGGRPPSIELNDLKDESKSLNKSTKNFNPDNFRNNYWHP